jgi:hypothetical protein
MVAKSLVLTSMFVLGCGGLPLDTDGGTTGGGSGGGTGGGAAATGFRCATTTLFAGNPNGDPSQRPAFGSPLLNDPPYSFRSMSFIGDKFVSHSGEEVVFSDLTQSPPTLQKIAGQESPMQSLKTGPCAAARFANLFWVVKTSSGDLVVSDQTANAVLKMTSPFTAACTVSHFAGSKVDVAVIDRNAPPNLGNADGPGNVASFRGPARLAIGADDTVYVYDEGNDAIRKIANDAAHTVSTLATISRRALTSMVVLGSKLYLWGNDSASGYLLTEIDLASGTARDVISDMGDRFGASGSTQAGGMTSDGTNLYLMPNTQGIYQVNPTTGAARLVAGTGASRSLSFSTSYDPKVSHPANQTEFVFLSQVITAGTSTFLSMRGSDLYFGAQAPGSYVYKVGCTP